MFCPRCGSSLQGGHYCPRCGTALEHAGPLPPPSSGFSRLTVAAVLVAGTLSIVVALLAGLVLLLESRGGAARSATSSDPPETAAPADVAETAAPSATVTETVIPTAEPVVPAEGSGQQRGVADEPPSSAPTPAGTPPLGDVRLRPAGLFCRDLSADGYSYAAAVDYWRFHGQPNQMDADRNGIPCETVYPTEDVAAYWGPRHARADASLEPGLFCRDLLARGFSYAEATTYWWAEGAPDRMDADLDGIPCETVYPTADIIDFWYG